MDRSVGRGLYPTGGAHSTAPMEANIEFQKVD
jgi:hypothetical protein